jgi:hypothetical protein
MVSGTGINKLDLTKNSNLENVEIINNFSLAEIDLPSYNSSSLKRKKFKFTKSPNLIIKRNSYQKNYQNISSQ